MLSGWSVEAAAADAFILCSLAGKLKILEVVDAGMWNVAMCIPLGIFREASSAL
jgi:acetamidase/formamidase